MEYGDYFLGGATSNWYYGFNNAFDILNGDINLFPYGIFSSFDTINLMVKLTDISAEDASQILVNILRNGKYGYISIILNRTPNIEFDLFIEHSLKECYFENVYKYIFQYNTKIDVKKYIYRFIEEYNQSFDEKTEHLLNYGTREVGETTEELIFENRSYFSNFKLFIDGKTIKTNEDFNDILSHITLKRQSKMFEYLILQKGDFIVDFDKIRKFGNYEINSILDRIQNPCLE